MAQGKEREKNGWKVMDEWEAAMEGEEKAGNEETDEETREGR